MQTLIDTLAAAPVRVIVSMGPQHDQLRLAGNMAGAEFLPQVSVLPHVDAVITHGATTPSRRRCGSVSRWSSCRCSGTSTTTPSAARDGFGLRLDTYGHAPEELTGALDTLLADRALHERLARVRPAAGRPRTRSRPRGRAGRGGREPMIFDTTRSTPSSRSPRPRPAGRRGRARRGARRDRPPSRVCTAGGVLHGGTLMALADTTGAVCAFLNLPRARRHDGRVQDELLAAVRGGVVTATATPLHAGSTLMSSRRRCIATTGGWPRRRPRRRPSCAADYRGAA
jgi:hypothetical protein